MENIITNTQLFGAIRTIVGLFAFVLAIFGYAHTRKSFRQKNALETQRRFLSEKAITEALDIIKATSKEISSFNGSRSWEDYAKDTDAKECKAMLLWLNTLEDLAVGVRQGVFDEGILKSSLESTVIRTLTLHWPFIKVRQKFHPTTYSNFVWLAVRWKACESGIDRRRLFHLRRAIRHLNKSSL